MCMQTLCEYCAASKKKIEDKEIAYAKREEMLQDTLSCTQV